MKVDCEIATKGWQVIKGAFMDFFYAFMIVIYK